MTACQDAVVQSELAAKPEKRGSVLDHIRLHGNELIARDRTQKADLKVSGNSLNPLSEQAMGHGRIDQGGNHTSMQHAIITLIQRAGEEYGMNSAIRPGRESQPE